MNLIETNKAVEAMIFASDQPITATQIRIYLENGATNKTIHDTIKNLNEEYRLDNRAFKIVKLAGGYQMLTTPDVSHWISKIFKGRIKSRLSRPALESLAIITYKQPISSVNIEAIRGVNTAGVLRTLLERKLITVVGREKSTGRPLIYRTTQEFLKYFGLSKISDLPDLKELDEIMEDV